MERLFTAPQAAQFCYVRLHPMAVQKIELQVGEDLAPEDLLLALDDHRDEIKGLLLANLEYVDARATCDGFVLETVQKRRAR